MGAHGALSQMRTCCQTPRQCVSDPKAVLVSCVLLLSLLLCTFNMYSSLQLAHGIPGDVGMCVVESNSSIYVSVCVGQLNANV